MSIGRLQLWLEQMHEATEQALAYVEDMSNRIAHGYFELDIGVVWETTQRALPELLAHLPTVAASARSWPAAE